MSAFRIDGTFSTASAIGPLVLSFPFGDRDTTAIIYTQRFMVYRANYAAPTLSSANGTYATAYCVGDTNFEGLGAGIICYDRQWATIPANRNEWNTKDYEFIGLITATGPQPPFDQYWELDPEGGRDPDVQRVNQRLYHEYFLCVAGQTYETPGAIPVIQAQQYILESNPNAKRRYLLPAGIYSSDTDPTTEAYLAMVGDEIVSEDSDLQRYLGEIYVRITPYVVAR